MSPPQDPARLPAPVRLSDAVLQVEHALQGLPWQTLPADLATRGTALADRIARELRPRLTATDTVVIGLLGPNNAGKSTLFSALSGAAHSPASPRGGHTRNLHGAAAADTLASLLAPGAASPLARRFALTDQPHPADAPPHALYLGPGPQLPPGVLLIDAPDFDSVYRHNHKAADALVGAADLLIAVVTRHTYANAAVHDMLRAALGSGRPWWVVLNEAPDDPEVAREQLRALVHGVGSAPDARFVAPHDLTVQAGERPLVPTAAQDGGPQGAQALTADAFRAHAPDLQRRALRASQAHATEGLQALLAHIARHQAAQAALRDELLDVADRMARAVAASAVPLEPLADALREELDARGGLHTWARRPLDLAAGAVQRGRDVVLGRLRQATGGTAPDHDDPLHRHEAKALRAHLDSFVRGALDVVGTWTGPDALRPDLPPTTLRAIQADTLPGVLHDLAQRLDERNRTDDIVSQRFADRCRTEVRAAIEARGGDAGLQWAATALATLPAALVMGELALTGGMSTGDVAFTAGVALAAPAWRALVDRVGARVVQRVQEAWIADRAPVLAQHAVHALLPTAWPLLQAHPDLQAPLNHLHTAAAALQRATLESP